MAGRVAGQHCTAEWNNKVQQKTGKWRPGAKLQVHISIWFLEGPLHQARAAAVGARGEHRRFLAENRSSPLPGPGLGDRQRRAGGLLGLHQPRLLLQLRILLRLLLLLEPGQRSAEPAAAAGPAVGWGGGGEWWTRGAACRWAACVGVVVALLGRLQVKQRLQA